MTLRRAAPGPQLAAGRIRVDAGKAIAKLREYQLADRSAWVLEAIRAAVAAKATRIELAADANDVWLSWQGPPWPDEVLPRLFDELVSPEAASESQHVRLLAAAINSALGMEPAHVDITAIHEARATRVRYTPEILVEPASPLGESTLRHVTAEPVAVPAGGLPGMLVHLRRRLADWRVFSAAPELALARGACRDIAVPLHVTDLVLQRDGARDVVRVPLGHGLDGFIAITEVERAGATAVFEVAERGVVLAQYEIDLFDAQNVFDAPSTRVPVRVFVDAPRLPTNASRSQVRRDAHPIADAEKRAHALVPELIGALVKEIQQGSERARASALALLAAHAGGSRWHVDIPTLRGPLRELAQLPLVKNAVGQPRSLSSHHWRAEIHAGRKPFDAELAPWLEHVLWTPAGDPSSMLTQGAPIDTRGTRRLLRWARKQLRAQKQFFAHQQREIRVLSSATPHVRAPLGVAAAGSAIPDAPFAHVKGEICIYTEGHVGALVVLLDGRELERIEFDSPLAFDAVIDSARVSPEDQYRGVKRDAEYSRVERAMRAGIVRALEAHVLANYEPNDRDAALVRRGLGVIREIGGAVKGPLTAAPAFRTTDGRWLSLAELAKLETIGIAPPNREVIVPRGRVVVVLADPERAALASFVKARLISYRRTTPVSLPQVAAMLAVQSGGALLVNGPELSAVIAPGAVPELRLFHCGAELAERSYRRHWLPCTIAVDCDAIVPDDDWTRVVDDAGLGRRDYSDWEAALVRAIAKALLGEQTEGFVTSEPVELDGRLGRVLCTAIVEHDAYELLGAELFDRLRAAKLVYTLGATEDCSIADVAQQFPKAIELVEEDTAPVEGFAPLVASKLVARALAKLVGRSIVDGKPTLERHRRRVIRDRHLAQHRLAAQQPITVPAEHVIPIEAENVTGVVGVWTGPFEIRVFVEGRRFSTFHPRDRELPLVAAIEIPASRCDETFEAVPEETRRSLATEVRAAIPRLVLEIAKTHPHELADRGPTRSLLLGAWVSDDGVKQALRAAPAFETVQGFRISLDRAAQARRIVSVASWQGDWLGPDGEPPHELDGPVLFVPDTDPELSKILDKLHAGAIVDVTEDVARQQSRRRVARGLVPMPRVAGAAPALRRSLRDLGAAGTQFGLGEIALIEDAFSTVQIYQDGSRVREETLEGVLPAVTVAVELADPQLQAQRPALAALVQQLADLLVKQVLASQKLDALPPRVQRNLVRAAFARRLDGAALADLTLWHDFTQQLERHGDVWIMLEPTELEPLDEQRRVFFFERSTYDLAREHGWAVVNARRELELDALARINRARPPATRLELPTRDGVMAQVLLDGDGVSGPRGVVAVLSPIAANSRGMWPHQRMHPFDHCDDPCKWPTLSVVDDARLVPDRTWSAPAQNEALQAVAKAIREASERALMDIGEVPEDALVHLRVTADAGAEVAALRKATRSLIRGVFWLTGEPGTRIGINVLGATGRHLFVPSQPLALGGRLVMFAPDRLDTDFVLDQLCAHFHGKLVRALLKAEAIDQDLVAGHVAQALALRTLRVTDARAIEFPCFSPRPLDARGLSSLFKADKPVVVLARGATPDPDPNTIEVTDDGSLLAKVVIANLGKRVRRSRPVPKPRPAREEPQVVTAPKQQPVRAKPPEPPHRLVPLVKKLRARLSELGIGGYRWSIIERAEPMFAFSDEIEVAGDNVRLRALAAALASQSPLLDTGIDVVVAHLVTVLNVSLTQITDASEAHALGVLLNQPSAGRPRSRQSS